MLCALFFGSFNPLHYGHIAIARYLLTECSADQVRLILSPKNPLKDAGVLSDPEERLRALREAVSALSAQLEESSAAESAAMDEPACRTVPADRPEDTQCIGGRICVSDIEFHLSPPLYTINTLRHLRETEPGNRHILVIGADNIAILEEWHDWRSLIREFEIWVYPRTGTDAPPLCRLYNSLPGTLGIRFLAEAPLYDISSTQIRKNLVRPD